MGTIDKDMFLSIITPCYNSSATLYSTYKSLLNQNINNFEWVLIDDNSTDGGKTRNLIYKIKQESPFNIKYHFFYENFFGAKSFYKGCELACGKYVGLLDHDDQYVSNIIEKVTNFLSDPILENEKIAGLVGRCIDQNGKLIGPLFEKNWQISNEGEIRYIHGYLSEFVLFTKREILLEYLRMLKRGYTYGFLWAKISEKYNYIYVNDVFRVYDMSIPSSYTNNRTINIRYPEAKVEMRFHIWNSYRRFIFHQKCLTFKESVHIVFLIMKYRLKPDYKIIKSKKIKLLLLFSVPFACMKFFKRRSD
jgi:glycosyltransferase involved in cell wall biosynthesis